MDIPVIILTPQQLSKKKYYEKMKYDKQYIENRRKMHKKYYDKIKDDVSFKKSIYSKTSILY